MIAPLISFFLIDGPTNRAKVTQQASLRKAIVSIERIRETVISKPTLN